MQYFQESTEQFYRTGALTALPVEQIAAHFHLTRYAAHRRYGQAMCTIAARLELGCTALPQDLWATTP